MMKKKIDEKVSKKKKKDLLSVKDKTINKKSSTKYNKEKENQSNNSVINSNYINIFYKKTKKIIFKYITQQG